MDFVTHQYPLFRAYIGISHGPTLGSGYIPSYPLIGPWSIELTERIPFDMGNTVIFQICRFLSEENSVFLNDWYS